MNRILAVIVLAIGILGGLRLYLSTEGAPPPPPAHVRVEGASRALRMEITLTFDAAPDPFAGDQPGPSLRINQGEKVWLNLDREIPAGEIVELRESIPLTPGANEFYVRAHPKGNDVPPRGARVRIWQGSRILADATLWSEPGAPVEGPVRLMLPEEELP